MIDDTIEKIRRRLQQSKNLSPEKRDDLLELIAQLKTEIAALSKSDPERAQSIAGFAQRSAEAVTDDRKEADTVRGTIDELESSVAGFEAAHPGLTAVVNRIAATLSSIGI